MTDQQPVPAHLRKVLESKGLPFSDFVECALYDPEFGYYTTGRTPVGKAGDYVTSPALSPVFAFALSRLVREFVSRAGDEVCTVVDIGCGDGALIHSLSVAAAGTGTRFVGIDRSIPAYPPPGVEFHQSVAQVPRDGAQLLISNELFDALPFARLVRRGVVLRELWVTQHDGLLAWSEREARDEYRKYVATRAIDLADGQYADVSLAWESTYEDLASFIQRGLVVTFDYGYPESQLFDARARPLGTAAAYSQQRTSVDLLASPGRQDLTAHVNFSDLVRAGERAGLGTLFFDRQAKFLLALGITEHELFKPLQDVESGSLPQNLALLELREEARRLVLPADLGHDIRVLVQCLGLPEGGWSFQRKLY